MIVWAGDVEFRVEIFVPIDDLTEETGEQPSIVVFRRVEQSF